MNSQLSKQLVKSLEEISNSMKIIASKLVRPSAEDIVGNWESRLSEPVRDKIAYDLEMEISKLSNPSYMYLTRLANDIIAKFSKRDNDLYNLALTCYVYAVISTLASEKFSEPELDF